MIEAQTLTVLMLGQMMVAALLLAVARIGLRNVSAGSARIRKNAALLAFYGAALWPLASILPERLIVDFGANQSRILDLGAVNAEALLNNFVPPHVALGFVLIVVAGMILRFGKTALVVRQGERLAAGVELLDPGVYGLDPRMRCGVSEQVPGPLVAGLFRPVIVVPLRMRDATELPTLLLHEREHVINGDVRALLLQRLVEGFYWWNPLMRTLGRVLNEQREVVCDEAAAMRDERFALALTREALARAAWPAANLGGSEPERRLERLATLQRGPIAKVIAALLVLTAIGVFIAPRLDRNGVTHISISSS